MVGKKTGGMGADEVQKVRKTSHAYQAPAELGKKFASDTVPRMVPPRSTDTPSLEALAAAAQRARGGKTKRRRTKRRSGKKSRKTKRR